MKVKEFIVVEGKHDTVKIQEAVDADTIETNGSALSSETIEIIRHANKQRGVIVFTDPDYQGERIRHLINQAIPNCKHAFLPKEQTIPKSKMKKSVGIEHASVDDIRHALEHVHTLMPNNDVIIKREDLLFYGLIGGLRAKSRRKSLGKKLLIGEMNAKQLLKRLNQFQISREVFKEAIEEVIKEEQTGGNAE